MKMDARLSVGIEDSNHFTGTRVYIRDCEISTTMGALYRIAQRDGWEKASGILLGKAWSTIDPQASDFMNSGLVVPGYGEQQSNLDFHRLMEGIIHADGHETLMVFDSNERSIHGENYVFSFSAEPEPTLRGWYRYDLYSFRLGRSVAITDDPASASHAEWEGNALYWRALAARHLPARHGPLRPLTDRVGGSVKLPR